MQQSIDTTTPGGELVFHVFGAPAELGRNPIRGGTRAGLTAARAGGRTGGGPKSLDAGQTLSAVDPHRPRKHTVAETGRTVGISKPTLHASGREAGIHAS